MIDWKKIISQKKENPYLKLSPFIEKNGYYIMKPLIKVKSLTQKFKDKVVYENIDFEIYENERLAFLGPNGAGKTTVISSVSGFLKQTQGNIEYFYDYEKKPTEKISVQFQDLKFPNSLTPKDLINFTIKLTNSKEYENEIIEGIKIFEIEKILNTKISKLSGGQQQRINVFISMIGRPKILFLDEFTTGLDISIKNRIQNYILEFCNKNKITLVLISHDIDSIEIMTQRIIVLANKKIYVDAKKDDIEKNFGSIKNILKKYIVQ